MSDFKPLDKFDRLLIDEAQTVLAKNYHPVRHSVGAAVRCSSDMTFVGVNVEACGFGPCAEAIAIGSAISAGERDITAIVAVHRKLDSEKYDVISPCGNCRQLIIDYAPDCQVIVNHQGESVKIRALELLPAAYKSDFE